MPYTYMPYEKYIVEREYLAGKISYDHWQRYVSAYYQRNSR